MAANMRREAAYGGKQAMGGRLWRQTGSFKVRQLFLQEDLL